MVAFGKVFWMVKQFIICFFVHLQTPYKQP